MLQIESQQMALLDVVELFADQPEISSLCYAVFLFLFYAIILQAALDYILYMHFVKNV